MKLLVVSILLLTSSQVFCHKLTLSTLISLSKKQNWEDVNDYLIDKGWEYTGSSKGVYDKCNTISWAYDKDQWDDYAKSWFKLFDCGSSVFNLSYQVGTKEDYNLVFNALSSNGFKKTNSSILDDALVTDYANSSYVMSVQTIKTEGMYGNAQTTYLFQLTSKADIYDPNNGLQYTYYPSLKVKEEFTITDGVLNGVYKAYFQNGKLEIQGNYSNGKANGEFFFYNEQGELWKRCNFKNDKLDGEYFVKYEDGGYANGAYLNGLKNGIFSYYDKSGKLSSEQGFKNDAETGIYRSYENNILVLEMTLSNGVKNGLYKEFYNTGVVKQQGNYSSDKKQGVWKAYWPNNQLKSLKTFSNDELTGVFKEYSEDGQITFEGMSKAGELEGLAKWYDNGRLDKEMIFLGGEPNGQFTFFRYMGDQLVAKRTGTYLNGELNGLVQSFRILGTNSEVYDSDYYTNGKLNGPSQTLQGDSLIFVNYTNDLIDGTMIIYTGTGYIKEKDNVTSIKLDTSNLELIFVSDCQNGKFHGNSKSFSKGILIKQGSFYLGELDGCWSYYYSPFFEGIPNPYSGELFLLECYEKGKQQGESKRYSSVYIADKSPTSGSMKGVINKNETYIEQYYVNDMRHGKYIEKDTGGLLVLEGNFRTGKKYGSWVERSRLEEGNYLTFKGEYVDGLEEGVWSYYYNENQLRDRVNFNGGKLDGKWIVYFDDASETIRMELEFLNNNLKFVDIYNGESNPTSSYEIIEIKENEFSVIITSYQGNGRTVTTYRANEEISKMNYHFFDTALKISIDEGRTVKDGNFEEYESDELVVQGKYLGGKKIGSWGHHDLDQNITMVLKYENDKVINETYYEYNTNILYKGTFEYTDPNSGLVQKRKIKDGQRHGKTVYYGSSGEVLKKELYSYGILQKN